jgi:hypothetical protein
MSRAPDFHAEMDRLQSRLPGWLARLVNWARKPYAVWFRGPAALLFIAGGIVGFLPVLGFWMVPLGLALIAIDLPFLRGPFARGLSYINAKLAAQPG